MAQTAHQKSISVAVSPYGYDVFTNRGSVTVDHYSAGNCSQDSIQIVPLNDPSCLSIKELRTLARRTARELAGEHGVPRKLIEFDYEH